MVHSKQINKLNFTTKMLYPSLTFGENGPLKFAKEVAANQPDVLFLNLVWERINFFIPIQKIETKSFVDKFYELTCCIKQISPNTNIELIIHSVHTNAITLLDLEHVSNVTFIDFYALAVWHRVYSLKLATPSPNWNLNKRKFLFLSGKPNKSNRIRLLFKFYQQGLLNYSTWSFHQTDELKKECRKLLPELSDQAYNEFVEQHTCNPDSATVFKSNSNSMVHCRPIPFSTSLYQDNVFQVISETSFVTNNLLLPFITEKTWLAILNRRPFIIASEVGLLTKLKQMGFRTFEQYLLDPEYHNITDDEKRLNAVVENTKYWLDNIDIHADAILDDVEYNFQLFQNLISQEQKKLKNKIKEYNLDCEINNIVELVDPVEKAQWVNWYNQIKDSSWPECTSENNFHLLPIHIQTECIEVFGYTPKDKT